VPTNQYSSYLGDQAPFLHPREGKEVSLQPSSLRNVCPSWKLICQELRTSKSVEEIEVSCIWLLSITWACHVNWALSCLAGHLGVSHTFGLGLKQKKIYIDTCMGPSRHASNVVLLTVRIMHLDVSAPHWRHIKLAIHIDVANLSPVAILGY
jgi:hypothetical protein